VPERTIEMSHFINDLKYGLRMLAKSPGFAVLVVLTPSLGIGVNSVIFSPAIIRRTGFFGGTTFEERCSAV